MKKLIKRISAKLGYQTEKKLILFLSDDWGAVRLKSAESRENLQRMGIDVKRSRFDYFDCLESEKDLEELYEVLLKHKDHKGNPFCITAVTNVANPDFKAIKDSGFKQYFSEVNTETYKRHPGSERVHELVMEGLKQKIFVPQSHAAEHLQTAWWMSELQHPDSMARKIFEEEFYFLPPSKMVRKDIPGLGASLNARDDSDFERARTVVKDSLDTFESLFGFRSSVFVPPAMTYPTEIYPEIAAGGIKWMDVPRLQIIPKPGNKTAKRFRYLGQKSRFGFRYLVRNTVFESNMSPNDDGVNNCLSGIKEAFDLKQPAIISNHRASFVGGIEKDNREKGLKALDKLLGEILRKWPDAEFVSIDDL